MHKDPSKNDASEDDRPDGAHDARPGGRQPDTPMTQQQDKPVPGRQRYDSARPPGDYTEDFGAGGTIEHPVKSDD